jgi:hypothetical protein
VGVCRSWGVAGVCRSREAAGVRRNRKGEARIRRARVCRSRERAGVCRSWGAAGVRRNRKAEGVWTPTFADGAASNLDRPSNAPHSGRGGRRTSPAGGVSSSQGPLRRLDCIRRGEHSVAATNITDIVPVIVGDLTLV